jgi:hypothetical protein
MRRIILLACLLLLTSGAPAWAQGGTDTRMVLGAGFGFAGGDGPTKAGAGVTAHAGLSHQRGPLVFALRAGSMAGGSTGQRIPGGGTLHDRFDELGLLAGYEIFRQPGSHAVLSAGIAAVAGERVALDGRGNRPFATRPGIPLQLDISNPDAARSVGLGVHVNLNAEEVFGTMTVRYLIGRGAR